MSLTDIARYRSIDHRITIHNWLRGRDIVEFLGLWEALHNPNFKRIDFDTLKQDACSNAYVFSIKITLAQKGNPPDIRRIPFAGTKILCQHSG